MGLPVKIFIDEATVSDVNSLADLYREAYRASAYPSRMETLDAETVHGWLESRAVYVLKGRDGIIGAVQTEGNRIKRLAVRPSRQQQGYGTALLEYAEAKVLDRAISVEVRVNDQLEWLVDLYKDRGYEVIKHEALAGYPYGVLLMRKTRI